MKLCKCRLHNLENESEETAMERRKLTKEDIDKVRNIEGFPIGTDEDIIALSDAPFYTACPNPFIEDFIKEYGIPYDEATDDYHREPFAADVSEGKTDPIYMAHTYHTKVPHKAIMQYILHYTKPGDLVLDGFCGTGMTGVAAQMCGCPDNDFRYKIEQLNPSVSWGARKAILNDLSPSATFIASNYNAAVDGYDFSEEAHRIVDAAERELGWMYSTHPIQENLLGEKAVINYTLWSDVFYCPHCGKEIVFWNIAIDSDGNMKKELRCDSCGSIIKKSQCARAKDILIDKKSGKTIEISKQVPVLINYSYGGKRYDKVPDAEDIALIEKIKEMDTDKWYPTEEVPYGEKTADPIKAGFNKVNLFYTERNIFTLVRGKIKDIEPVFSFTKKDENCCVSCGSSTDLRMIPSNSIDYIFVDPPFGDNLIYSELSFIWDAWLRIVTNNEKEAIICRAQKKALSDYQDLFEKCFREFYRCLKPNRWITIEFHNSKNTVWMAINEAIQKAGFVVSYVKTLDKGQGSYNQQTANGAVKQDLAISAYKPKEEFERKFSEQAGSEETAWFFVGQYLDNLPVVSVENNKIQMIAERQAYLLFDRMVAYHIMRGIPVPLDATDFYRGLDEKFLKRDNMYFLPDQVNEYDTARITTEVENIQFALFVTNEKSAISWLYQQLDPQFCGPQTYAELQPKFMQEVKAVDKYEQMPELATILEENFLQDENGRWYIPDVTKEGDLVKLREKNLWKEFESYMNSKGKLKLFRSEAIRVGFSRLWKEKNYKAIVDIAERLPEQTIQEDSNLLMYYDISLGRV